MNPNDMIFMYKTVMKGVDGSNLCAILCNKNKILSVGYNTPRTKITMFRSSKKVPSKHAEMDCISTYISTIKSGSRKVQTCDLVVIRMSKDEKLKNSKPCKHCAMFISSMFVRHFIKIKNITYFDEKVIEKNIYDLELDHVSKGWKKFYVNK